MRYRVVGNFNAFLGAVTISVIAVLPSFLWFLMARTTRENSLLLIAIAAFSLSFAAFAIPNETFNLLGRYYVGVGLGGSGFFIRLFDVLEKTWQRKYTRKRVEWFVRIARMIQSISVNLLFAFPVMVWVFAYIQSLRIMVSTALLFSSWPIPIAVATGILEYKLLYGRV